MVVDGTTFLRRARQFFAELKAGRYPNSGTLAEQCGCSKNTAQRTIYRLRDEYLVPLEYDASERGYYLRNPGFQLSDMLPPGKDELTALLLARQIIGTIEAADLREHLDRLWQQYAASTPLVARDLEPLAAVFSADSTVIGDITDSGLLRFVTAAAAGESVRIVYRSPWRHTEDRTYEGRIGRVHLSDGSLYLLMQDASGRERILNASFIKSFEVLTWSVPIATAPTREPIGSERWLDGFGVWAGSEPEEIEIRILPPAAIYYAAQRWHADQEDAWEGEILIRRLRGIVSPELVRRVLSLGRFVHSVKPESLRDQVFEDSWQLLRSLEKSSRFAGPPIGTVK